jgi:hypothetical protein
VAVFQDGYQRIGLRAAAIFTLLSVAVGFGVFVRPKTSFEWDHARAEAANPKWVRVEITTTDSRREYRENEPIYIVPRFCSAVSHMYKIEIAEGESRSAIDLLHISNGKIVPRNLVGIVCCFSRLVGLDDEPYSPPTVTPLKLPPGQYEFYLTTRRVSTWDVGAKEYNPSSIEVASNLLKIRVVPEHK